MRTHRIWATTLAAGALLGWAGAARSGIDRAPVRAVTAQVTAGGRSLPVTYVKARLDDVEVKLGLAQRRVARAEALDAIARRYGAVSAINGGFFDAYTRSSIRNPVHTLITDGHIVHKGNIGTILGFTADGDPLMGRLPLRIEGSLNGSYRSPHNWYAYWVNRLPQTATNAIIYTPAWGPSTGLDDGVQVVVSDGRVEHVGRGSQRIPRDGYVVYLRGREEKLAARFRPGSACEYRFVRADGNDMDAWAGVQEGLGCGPRLVTNGRVTLDARGEGFSDPKVLSHSAARSVVGVTRDRELLLVTSTGTMRQMADLMKALGAEQAMNLDGGASSGLWAEGRYVTRPGRAVGHALLVLAR